MNISTSTQSHRFVKVNMSWCLSHFPVMQPFLPVWYDVTVLCCILLSLSSHQLGIVTTSNKRAEKLSEMTGNPRKHTEVNLSISKQFPTD